MSYEYKDLIAQSISAGEYRYAIEDEDYQEYREARVELDHVYVQAAKVDEYEAKAKAFDEVMDLYVNGSNKYLQTKRHTLDVFIEDVAEILKPFTDKYESGESE